MIESGDGGSPTAAERQEDLAPEPTWRAGERSARPPRIPLTREAIIDAAVRVLDREGLEGLSMRRVADELATGPASIYWHVRNKEELLQLIYERVTAEVELPEPDPARYQDQLRELARRQRTNMNSHRDFAQISLGRLPSGPTVARYTEWLFQLLTPVGIPDEAIVRLGDLFALYIGAYAFEESLGIASPTGEDLQADEIVTMFREYMTSLPPARYPHIHRVFELLFSEDTESRFNFGVDLLIRGLATYATKDPEAEP